MLTMRGAPPLLMTDAQRDRLDQIARSSSLPHRAVRQADALLAAADGVPNEHIGRRVGVSANTVRAWRADFARQGVAGVGTIAKGRGRKAYLPEGTVAEVIRVTCNELPEDTSTHWTTRTLAKKLGVGKDTVARIWKDHELKPWKVDSFKVSNDPAFEAKLVDVVGLYLDPPVRQGGGVQFRRENPVPGARSDPAVAADAARSSEHHDA